VAMGLGELRTPAPQQLLAEEFSVRASELFGRAILFRAANLAGAFSAAGAAISMAEEHAAEPSAFGRLAAAEPAPAVLMLSAARALPEIYGSVLHLSRPDRVEPGAEFAVEMSIFASYRRDGDQPWSRLG
jgi:hypothetical protein